MKHYSKSQLAQAAGVSYSTFQRWLKRNEKRMSPLGYSPTAKLLTPKLVRFICHEYGIDEEDLEMCA